MTRSSPRSTPPYIIISSNLGMLPFTVNFLEGGYAQWHRSQLGAIAVLLSVFLLSYLIYYLYTEWGDVIAQYRSQALFRDRAFTFPEVIVPVGACALAVLVPQIEPKQTGLGPWDEVIRVVIALLLVTAAIPGIVPGFVHMWVALKNRRSKSGELPSKIG